ncbi:MAG: 50S ribosomal protein L23 [Planctomycetes bacterium]|nr:50S ribosomal protein L23 [Planctomycetota bacterium]
MNLGIYDIIRRPRVTEKAVYLQNEQSTYTFEVHPKSNKNEIRKAVETLFKVKVRSVTTQNYDGTARRVRSKLPGLTAGWKKAMVRLVDGQTIEGI